MGDVGSKGVRQGVRPAAIELSGWSVRIVRLQLDDKVLHLRQPSFVADMGKSVTQPPTSTSTGRRVDVGRIPRMIMSRCRQDVR